MKEIWKTYKKGHSLDIRHLPFEKVNRKKSLIKSKTITY